MTPRREPLRRPVMVSEHSPMRSARVIAASASVALALVIGTSGCSRPDLNPAVRITGDPQAANPAPPTTSSTTTTAVPTTLYYGAK